MSRLIAIIVSLLLASCREEPPAGKSKSAEELRIEQEVARQFDASMKRIELKSREMQLQTLRVAGFILLAGAAAAGLVWVRQSRFPNITTRSTGERPVLPEWNDHYEPGTGRVIDPLSGDRPAPDIHTNPRNHAYSSHP